MKSTQTGGGGSRYSDSRYSDTFFCAHKRPSPFFYTYPHKKLF